MVTVALFLRPYRGARVLVLKILFCNMYRDRVVKYLCVLSYISFNMYDASAFPMQTPDNCCVYFCFPRVPAVSGSDIMCQ